MGKVLVLTNNEKHIPDDLNIENCTVLTIKELYDKGENGEVIDFEKEIYVDIEFIDDSDIYDDLIALEGGGDINVSFYSFDGIKKQDFIKRDVREYKTIKEIEVVIEDNDDEEDDEYSKMVAMRELERERSRERDMPHGRDREDRDRFRDLMERDRMEIGDRLRREIEEEPISIDEDKEETEDIDIPVNVNSNAANSIINNSNNNNMSNNSINSAWTNLINDSIVDTDQTETKRENNGVARVILFGSSKGGTGKTFTSVMSAYRYAKTHPHERVAFADFDIIDGQVGITIQETSFTLYDYYRRYEKGETDFNTMYSTRVKSKNFPSNIEFYLAPKDNIIKDNDFWFNVFNHLITNYDVVFFDSGIDYLNYDPISTLYKIADKIILVSSTSIKSVTSVIKQIKKLKGVISNEVFTKEDEIGDKLNAVLTRVDPEDGANATIEMLFENENVPILASFGNLDKDISQAEWYGNWSIFDDKDGVNSAFDNICK